mmetsp:Transcript_62456/g.201435  ORF Transcript_62456/g.201435 Transcript_62456/m.201435 type:complete len:218 (+) Transcript_62456:1053-1706(+)
MACLSSFRRMFTTRCVATTILWSRRLMRRGSERPLRSGMREPHNAERSASASWRSGLSALATAAAAFTDASNSKASDSSVPKCTDAGSVSSRRYPAALPGASPRSPPCSLHPSSSTEPLYTLRTPTATERVRAQRASQPPPEPAAGCKSSRAATSCSISSGRVQRTAVTERSGGSSPVRSCASLNWTWLARATASPWNSGSAFSLSHFVSTSTGGKG